MPIHVIQNGIDRPPDEAWNCPHCGTKAVGYKTFADQNGINREMQFFVQTPKWIVAPTFSCEKCGCIWQYEKEMHQPESEAANQEDKELDTPSKDIQAGDGVVKPDDGKIEAAEDKCHWYKKLWDIFTFRSSRW